MSAESIGTKIDHLMNETERALSIGAAFPVVGTVAGLSKVLIGVAQTIVGLAGGILTLPARCMDNAALNDHFWTHAKHGIGNIVAGTLEAIPLVGTGMFIARLIKSANHSASVGMCIVTTHEEKFMPYMSLCARDIEITGLAVEENARELFAASVNQALIANPNLSYEDKYTLANQAMAQAEAQARNPAHI